MITDDIKNLKDECEAMRLDLADLKQIIYRLNGLKGHYHQHKARDGIACTVINDAIDRLDRNPSGAELAHLRTKLAIASAELWPTIAMAAPAYFDDRTLGFNTEAGK